MFVLVEDLLLEWILVSEEDKNQNATVVAVVVVVAAIAVEMVDKGLRTVERWILVTWDTVERRKVVE